MSSFRTGIIFAILLEVLQPIVAAAGTGEVENRLKNYFNEVALRVEREKDPAQKRVILNRTFDKTTRALEAVAQMPGLAQEDRAFLASFQQDLQDKSDELNGRNGYIQVKDDELDSFSDYVLQDTEQARRVVIVTTTTVLIVAAILILLLAMD